MGKIKQKMKIVLLILCMLSAMVMSYNSNEKSRMMRMLGELNGLKVRNEHNNNLIVPKFNLRELENDSHSYLDVLSEQATDEEDEESDDYRQGNTNGTQEMAANGRTRGPGCC